MAATDIPATMTLYVHRKTINPAKKRISATLRRAGIAAMIAGTFHSLNASKRFCRRMIAFRGSQEVVVHSMYSRSHCFAIIPKRADVRLNMRLRNHNELIQRAEPGTWKSGREAAGWEEFAVCADIWRRMLTEAFPLSCCSIIRETRAKAESTAEKRPA